METFDVVVIGAGPAGYVAAVRCAQLGFRTACADNFIGKDGTFSLGGTCLNVGCIPSKALLDSSEHYHLLRTRLVEHGIGVQHVSIDVAQMIRRKDEIVRGLTQGVEGLFHKHQVRRFNGRATLAPNQIVNITPPQGSGDPVAIQGKHIIIATGSSPRELPGMELDGERIVDSSSALDFTEVPPRLGIIGAGVIGIELGSVWRRLGSQVILLEAMDQFLYFVDTQLGRLALREFTAQGLDIRLGARVLEAEAAKNHVTVRYQDAEGEHAIEFDRLIVAVGRKPNTENLRLEDLRLLTDENGYIHVDDHCRTNIPNIFAVGDVVRGPMLAHKGSEEGIMVAERMAGQQTEVRYDTIPWVIYTSPEIAWVGKTEDELKAAAHPCRVGTFPLSANGRARAMQTTAGLVKVIADKESDEILGVHIFAPTASEMIAEAVVAMEYNASAEDLARIVHAHPTLSEAIREAALAVHNRSLSR
jgi:dihydrolipoamide dehydrogenase